MIKLIFTLGAIWLINPTVKQILLGKDISKKEGYILAIMLLAIIFTI